MDLINPLHSNKLHFVQKVENSFVWIPAYAGMTVMQQLYCEFFTKTYANTPIDKMGTYREGSFKPLGYEKYRT